MSIAEKKRRAHQLIEEADEVQLDLLLQELDHENALFTEDELQEFQRRSEAHKSGAEKALTESAFWSALHSNKPAA